MRGAGSNSCPPLAYFIIWPSSKIKCQLYKTFYVSNLQILIISYRFVSGKPFQPCLMFVGTARRLPKSGAPKSTCSRQTI